MNVSGPQLELISSDPLVMHGQAVIAGTRVPVSVVLDCLAAGMTVEEMVAEYPTVGVAGVRAAAAGFEALGDTEAVEQCALIAERLDAHGSQPAHPS